MRLTARSTRINLLIALASLTGLIAGSQPALAALTGPDVSSAQHPNGASVDWSKVRAAGHSFAFVKATEGPTGYYTNPYFAADWAGIRGAGMVRGTYHFARPEYSATDQASYFTSVVGNVNEPGDLPPVLDLERTGGLSPSQLVAWTQTFLSTVQALTGRAPMIYSYPYFWHTSMADTTNFTAYPLWLADYTGTASPSYPLPGAWGAFTFWQFTSSASIPGVPGNVDLSSYCCDARALSGLAGQRTCLNGNRGAMIAAHPGQQVAVVGTDCGLWTYQNPGGVYASMGGLLLGAPAVVASGPGATPYYIGTGSDHDLWVRGDVGAWQKLITGGSAYCIDNPAAVITGGTIWVACQGSDHALWVSQGPISPGVAPQVAMNSWRDLGGSIINGPGAAVVTGTPTFFVVGQDRRISYRTMASVYTATAWTCNGHPAVATYNVTSYFACQGSDRSLYYSTNTGNGWSAAQSIGGVLTDGPGIAAAPTGPTFFVEGGDSRVYERTLTTGWASDGGVVDYGVGAAYVP